MGRTTATARTIAMARLAAASAVVVLTVIAVAAGPVAGVAQPTPETPAPNESVMAPGERFGGVVGVQGAELAGDLERRTFDVRIARGTAVEARAAVVAEKLDEVEARLAELEDRKQALDRARENGTISDGSYDARVAVIAVQQSNLRSQLEASEAASAGLPPELLEREGIDGSSIRALERDAATLTGPEVAATVRTIAGPDVGTLVAGDPVPDTAVPRTDVGPGGNRTAAEEPPRGSPVDAATTTTDGDGGDEGDDGPVTIDLG